MLNKHKLYKFKGFNSPYIQVIWELGIFIQLIYDWDTASVSIWGVGGRECLSSYMVFHESYGTNQSLPTMTSHSIPKKTQSRREDL